MIKQIFNTSSKVDIPVTSYDFSELTDSGKMYTVAELRLIKKQKGLTSYNKNIIDITENYDRQRVMIFSSGISRIWNLYASSERITESFSGIQKFQREIKS